MDDTTRLILARSSWAGIETHSEPAPPTLPNKQAIQGSCPASNRNLSVVDSQANLDSAAEHSPLIHLREEHLDSDLVLERVHQNHLRRPGVVADLRAESSEVRLAADSDHAAAGADGGAKNGLLAQSQ